METVVYLIVRAHEINARMVHEFRCVAVIPLAVKLNEIPVVAVCRDGISFDHHVGDAGAVEKHFRAAVEDVAVSRAPAETEISGALIGQ